MTIIDYIKQAKNVLIVGHQRPDGDCLGSGLTILNICKKYSVNADFICDSPIPAHFDFMPNKAAINVQNFSDYDLLITVDCADKFRMGKYIGYLQIPQSINIDHHKTNDNFAKLNIIERNASSTCEIIYKILKPLNELNDDIAFCLFVGLSTDTGHFMHNNTTAEVFAIASELCKFNVSSNQITNFVYKSNTMNKTKLIAKAIDSMRFFCDNKICIISVTQKMLNECSCDLSDTEGLIDFGMQIDTVDVAVCITEQLRPQYKVSYRSKTIDVAASAGIFGGGGHTLASGCVANGSYEDVIRKILKSITDFMDI